LIANQVAEKILSINGKTPQAVLCVGGGSLMPGLTEKIALHLGLPSNRVSIRGKESIQGFTDIPKILDGPHCITPLGIVMTTFSRQAMTFVQVTVNSRTIRLLKAGNLTVAEALLTAGVQMRHLYGKPGPGLTVRVNNQVYTIKGGIPQAALVTKNGQKAGFDDKIIEGDSVEFIPAKDGEPAKGFIRDVIPKLLSKTIVVNGNKIVLKPVLLMNGIEVDEKTPLIDNANIYYQKYDTVAEVASFLGKKKVRAMLNGKEAVEDTIINDGDSVNFIDELDEKITVVINDKEYYVPFAGSEMILLDVFSHIDIDASNLSRQRYMIEINGIEAAFTTPIHKDDKIGIKWH
jgi:molybdopterin converting factor small subunit